jgi:hypothetical protein
VLAVLAATCTKVRTNSVGAVRLDVVCGHLAKLTLGTYVLNNLVQNVVGRRGCRRTNVGISERLRSKALGCAKETSALATLLVVLVVLTVMGL